MRKKSRYYSIPLITGDDHDKEKELFRTFSNSGEVFLHNVEHKEYNRRIIEALKTIADPENHPLVFHCSWGKARTGVLAAIVLSVLGVEDEDIIADYILTDLDMKKLIERWNTNPLTVGEIEDWPKYYLNVDSYSMAYFLSSFKRKYNSVRGYIGAQGEDVSLIDRLTSALLI